MKPLPQTPFLRIALAAALLLGAAPVFAATSLAEAFHKKIVQEDSLSAAQELLADTAFQAAWKSEDSKAYEEAFAAAAELKDIGDLVMGMSQPRAIRLGLEKRAHCKFCAQPARLEAWFRKEIPWADDSRIKALREATLAWEFVPAPAKPTLAKKPLDAAAWDKLDFPARMAHIREWSDAELAAILKTTPRTPAEYKAIEARAQAIGGVVGNSESARLWERVNHAKMAVDGLARAEKLVGRDPAKRKALEAARGADLEGMLDGLNGLFDGAGVKDPAFRAAAPPKPGQRFDDASRALVAGLLSTGLMKETEGTFAGKDLTEFYEKNKLDLRVKPPLKGQENWIGWHQGGVITFNERHIEEYLKADGRNIKDLSRDPELLRRLTVQLAPLFVHEATHQRQMVWAAEQRLPWMGGQNLELETMQVEALFIVEKRRRDPSFDALLQRDKDTSLLARESLSKSDRLVNGLQTFRDSINAWHYPELLSLEGTAWCQLKWHREMTGDLEKELERRKHLSSVERDRLEKAAGFPARMDDDDAWKKALAVAGTPHVRGVLESQRDGAAGMSGRYAAYRKRLEAINDQTAERLQAVRGEPHKTKGVARGVVPPAPGRD